MSDQSMRTIEPMDTGRLVHRLVAPNPGSKTLQGTNTYLVGHSRVLIIDPGPSNPEHLSRIVDWLRRTGRTALGLLLTHGHPDHASGAASLAGRLEVPIRAADAEPYPLYSTPPHLSLAADDVFEVDGDSLRVLATPGHTPDSVSFMLAGAGLIFTGDTILGSGSTVVSPPEGDMAAYMDSLERLSRMQGSRLAPGHGPMVVDARAKIQEYVDHRRARESQLLSALAGSPSTASSLVNRLYTDTPSDLRYLAEGSVTAGLRKLEREDKVQWDGECWRLFSSAAQ